MALEFGNDFFTPCEASAWIWPKGDDPIRQRPIAIIVVDVHNLSFNECIVSSDEVDEGEERTVPKPTAGDRQ